MARTQSKELTAAIRAPFWKRFGLKSTAANTTNSLFIGETWAADNTYEHRWRNAADTDDVRALSVDSDNRVYVAESATSAGRKTVTFYMDTNAQIATQVFFIADRAYRIAGISYMSRVISSVAGTAYVEKLTGTTAPGSGTTVQSGTFDLTATAATVVNGTLATTNSGDSDNPTLVLAAGDRLGIVVAGTITSLLGVAITVTLAPGGSARTVLFNVKATADLAFTSASFFVANRPYVVTRVDAVYSTASSVAALTLTVTKDTSTNAPGAGTALLTTAMAMDGTANTVVNGALSATAATVRLATGDRLSAKFSGATVTALVGVVLQVTLQELSSDRKEVTYALEHVPGATDLVGIANTCFFIADRDYEVLDAREYHNVVGSDGSAVTIGVTADSGTTAPGSGTAVITALSLKATARTVQVGALAVLGSRFLLTGDRLSTVVSGTFTAAEGVVVTVALAPK